MHYYATGQSAAGLYAVVAQILVLSGQLEPTTSALYYFISADLFLLITLAVYLSLPKYVSSCRCMTHTELIISVYAAGILQLLVQQSARAFNSSTRRINRFHRKLSRHQCCVHMGSI